MTEEVKQGLQETPATDQAEAPALTPTQEKAIEQGWKPKDQFEGAEEDFIDAAEFVRRGELFSKIEHQSKELKMVRQALDALKVHHTKVAENEYNRALKTLQAERKQARVDGEFEKADAIDEQIDEIKAEKEQVIASVPQVQELNPEFVQWTEKNSWYNDNKVMRAAADKIGLDYARQGHNPSEVLKMVEKDIRSEFPHKFTNAARERPNAVASASRGSQSVQRTTATLDDVERDAMRKFVRSGVMTEAQYLAELKKVKG